MANVLFVVENDYFPRDARVFNECLTVSEQSTNQCYVLAPRNNQEKEKFFEKIGEVTCFRYPSLESPSTRGLFIEYGVAAINFFFLIPLITFCCRIKVIHVANPPDFILVLVAWLKLFRVKFIFDHHDIAITTFSSKVDSGKLFFKVLSPILKTFERFSLNLADLVIATNNSFREYEMTINNRLNIFVIRNSNKKRYQTIDQIQKKPNDVLQLVYFGIIGSDAASGVTNLITLSKHLIESTVAFKIHVIGDGPGLSTLTSGVESENMQKFFEFHGFMAIEETLEKMIQYDFGIVTLNYSDKGHLHTAMKIMDYMCCAVPVCSLKLKEQMFSTGGIGVHAKDFEDMAKQIIQTFADENRYESLREQTLKHFNENLCWEKQAQTLIDGYSQLT